MGATDTTSVSRLAMPMSEDLPWGFDFGIQNHVNAQEWESLRRKFSYEAITGLTVAPRHVRAASTPLPLSLLSEGYFG
jgi:hypothetical protein